MEVCRSDKAISLRINIRKANRTAAEPTNPCSSPTVQTVSYTHLDVYKRQDVQGEFEEHAEEERRHAQLLADRIIELEGVPVLDPKKWFELARCKYDAPQGFDSVSLLKDNVASERCAILRYQEIADFTNGKDFTTCDIAKHILAEEEEHEQDLQDYLTDIARMKKSFLDK